MSFVLGFSSSRVGNGAYLETAAPVIGKFLGPESLHIAFIPFASVDSYPAYGEKVSAALTGLPYAIHTVSHANAKQIIEQSEAIMVGGGNTFKLLHDLYEAEVIELISEKVRNGTPYIGWSAGSNLAGPTICTTNDMPVIQPKSFTAFNFFPFQINPHYHNIVMEGFHGETRDQRLEEFLKIKPRQQVVCLPEGTALQSKDGVTVFLGKINGVLMYNKNGVVSKKEIQPGTVIETLLSSIEHEI